MDPHSRQRTRAIRTIGRLSAPAAEDILLAEWPLPASSRLPRQDIAISSGWNTGRLSPEPRNGVIGGQLESSDSWRLFEQHDRHQQRAIGRLLLAIESELAESDSRSLAFDAPPISREEVLAGLDFAEAAGEMSHALSNALRANVVATGEFVARLWALLELYRAGHIDSDELRTKRDSVTQALEQRPRLPS